MKFRCKLYVLLFTELELTRGLGLTVGLVLTVDNDVWKTVDGVQIPELCPASNEIRVGSSSSSSE